MKKHFITSLLLGSLIPAVSSAQYYNQGYYNTGTYPQNPQIQMGYNQPYYYPQQAMPTAQTNHNYGNSNYYKPHTVQQKKQREFGSVSVGADYVIGYSSYTESSFEVESALTGGESFVSDTRDFDRSLNSVSFNLGWRPFRNLGIEAFYSASLGDNKVEYTESYSHYPEFARGEYEVTYKVMGLDLLGFLPINDYIEFIASIGVGKYDAKAKVKVVAYEDNSYNNLRSVSKEFEDSAVAYRIGGGFQIWMSKHLTFRLMARWTQIGGDFMDYITEINAGVRYHF